MAPAFHQAASSAASFGTLGGRVGHLLQAVFLSPGSTFSLFSLGCALALSIGFLLLRRGRKSRGPLRAKAMMRALFPKWFWRSPSMRADVGFFVLNAFATGSLIGWGLFSGAVISRGVEAALNRAFGVMPPLAIAPLARDAIFTLALFVVYDFSYWVDHFLKHKIRLLWEFHRVHHTAEVLSPLTVFRMHPIDSLIFTNIVAVAVGTVYGIGTHVFGSAAHEAALSGTNIILVVFIFATVHLQHSHIDIRFRGWLGKIFFSPAHHHIHHSTLVEHYDSNLGSCLAVWDWMFGTLILPDAIGKKLTFGADTNDDRYHPHSMAGGLVWPFVRAVRVLIPGSRPATAAHDLSANEQAVA